MRKLLLVTASVVALAAPAFAADMSSPQPMTYTKAPMVAPAFTWTGFYLGAHGGYGWGRMTGSDPAGVMPDSTVDTKGGVAGGQIGYLYQIGALVLGVEGSYAWADIKQSMALGAGTATVKNDYIATVAGRAGYALDRALIYGKGGVAFTRDMADATDGLGGSSTGRFSRTGYVVGGGLEYAFLPNWSARVEYNYLGFGSQLETPSSQGGLVATPMNVRNEISTVTFGVNYHLN
ncbi:MAG: porin family protein [Rhizobiales bacterium]|nr:porin family protein [Hyphomicrobiales bacterium]